MAAQNLAIEQRLQSYRKLFQLDGKTALVLGAASGIGKASAEALAALGATVICADKNKAGVETTAAEIGGRAEVHVLDAGNGDAVNALAIAIETTHQRLDIAVTTPAIHVRKLMVDYTDEDYDRVADLNLRGTFFFLRAFGRIMMRQRGGSLIASSSVRATTLEPGLAIYGATKAAVIGLTKSVAADFIRDGIRCNAICPGTIVSPSLEERVAAASKATGKSLEAVRQDFIDRQPMGRLGTAQEVAALALFLASDEASYITGQPHLVDGGMAL